MIPVLTIDGPSGVGKGTVSNIVANELKWHILDSGAIYRAFALAASKRDLLPENTKELIDLASNLELKFVSSSLKNDLEISLLLLLYVQYFCYCFIFSYHSFASL